MEIITFQCPHCNVYIMVEKKNINCSIFRHGNYIHNYEPINPHASEQECNQLFTSGKIYGCGKPFKLILDHDNYVAEKCGYI